MDTTYTCTVCGTSFEGWAKRNRKYCTRSCMGVMQSKRMTENNPGKRPEVAAKISAAHKASGRFVGERHPNYKSGEWTRSDGRVMVRVATGVYRLRYRVVWDETHPDDPLLPGEIIHHINHVPSDDRPENLMKMRQGAHAREHDFGHHPGAARGWDSVNAKRRRAA